MAIIEKTTLTIKKLVEKSLTIPNYQRPYKWQTKHVEKLLNDIEKHRKKEVSRYRIGTIVIHKDCKCTLNIVDGQQRITTLALILYALGETENNLLKNNDNENKKKEGLNYAHKTSKHNIYNNYQNIKSFIESLEGKEAFKKFLLDNCEVVYIVLNDIDEAFQFFDSQNARGKGLEGYDLLKAFHLRETAQDTEEEKKEVLKFVKQWEEASNKKEEESKRKLKIIFDDLFAIRKYSRGQKVGGQNFTKEDVGEFKGFNPSKHTYPYIKSYVMNDIFIENQKNNFENWNLLLNERQKLHYPFQITGHILNGKRFFEYVQFYIKLKEELEELHKKLNYENKKFSTKKGTYRPMVDGLFKRVSLFYYDKFGNTELEEAIKYCYAWVYILFKHLSTLRFVSIDNKGADGNNGKNISGIKLFQTIRDALYHNQVIGLDVKNQLEIDWANIPEDRRGDKKLFDTI